jgi:hypothetical protein
MAGQKAGTGDSQTELDILDLADRDYHPSPDWPKNAYDRGIFRPERTLCPKDSYSGFINFRNERRKKDEKYKKENPGRGLMFSIIKHMPKKSLYRCASQWCIIKTSLRTALVVGTVLAFINHYESILALNFRPMEIVQIIITYFIPFTVATYAAARHAQRTEGDN